MDQVKKLLDYATTVNGKLSTSLALFYLAEIMTVVDLDSFLTELRLIDGRSWINTEDRMPLCYCSGAWDGLKSDELFVLDKNGDSHIAVAYSGIMDGSKFFDFYDSNNFEIQDIKYWMEIPIKF